MTAKPVANALRRTVGATRAKPSFTVNGYPLSQTIAMAIAVMMTAAPVRSRNACLASTPADVRCCAASRVAIVWMPRSVALSRMALRASTSENSPKRLGPKYRVTIGIEISDAARDRARADLSQGVLRNRRRWRRRLRLVRRKAQAAAGHVAPSKTSRMSRYVRVAVDGSHSTDDRRTLVDRFIAPPIKRWTTGGVSLSTSAMMLQAVP